VLNDRFFASDPDFVTFEYDVPAVPPARPWELCRGLSHSFCVNRAEREDDYLTAREIVAMLVETVAKGGNLLLNVGPNADGTLEEIQTRVLRESGAWVRAHADAIHGSEPFTVAGSGAHWFTRTGDVVHAFDLASTAEPRFAELQGITRATTPDGVDLPFTADGRIDARAVARHPFGTRYLVSCDATRGLSPVRVTRTGVAARLAAARPGEVVDLEAGVYDDEPFPLTVPAGVTLRGAGAAHVTIAAGGRIAIALQGDGAGLEGVTVIGGAPGYMMIPNTCVTGGGGDNLRVRDCVIESVSLIGGRGHVVSGNVIAGGKVGLMSTNACEVRANFQHGLRWGAGIEIIGGADHIVAENECRDDLCAIKCVETDAVRIERNIYETRWVGIHLLNARDTTCYRNQAWRTMRAVNVEGGHGNRVEKQLAEHCDSGFLAEGGADAVLADSWFHDCRVGIILWGAGDVQLAGNALSECRDHEIVTDGSVP
jgi:alpha-L-fucosidase